MTPLINLLILCTRKIHAHLGETEFQVGDVRRPITTWLTLSDSRHNISPYGELMFSLSYLPTAERLTVVVVKARNLKLNENDPNNSQQNVFVKVYTTANCVNFQTNKLYNGYH